MRYTWFEFENFKGIRKARLDLSASDSAARVYTLVGLNESGKTTVLEAIDLFRTSDDEVSPKQLSGWLPPDPHTLMPIAQRTNFNGNIVVRCGVELDETDEQAARAHLKRTDGYRLESLSREMTIEDRYIYADSKHDTRRTTWNGLRAVGKTKKGRVSRPITFPSDRERWRALAAFLRTRLPTIWFFPNFLFDFPDQIYLEPSDGEEDRNRFYRELFQDVLDALDKDLRVDQHVVARVRSSARSDQENLEQVLLEASRHVTHTVVSAWNQIFADKPMSAKNVRIEIGEDPSPGADEEGNPVPGRVWIQFRLEGADGLFSVKERSLGFRWFFVYLLLTTYRGRRSGASNRMLFLFDEPASNLHPTAQGALLKSLGDLAKDSEVIYTTHSHHLIEPKWLGTTFVVANTGLGTDTVSTDFSAHQTDITITPYRQFASHHPDQAHFFQPILDVLAYHPSRLEFVPEVVMVEGKSDFYLLAYYERVILGRTEEASLSFLPGGGAGTLDGPIQLYLGWARPFVALLDSDKAGKDQKDRYSDKFGSVVAPHLFGLSELTGKSRVRGIESLLTDAERLKLQRLADPEASTYKKKAMALGVQEGLVAGRPIQLCKTSRANLDAVIEGLRERLQTHGVPVG
ncbi:MAG: AAA family ATPase [Polyangiaceae bacterium]|nr:AAA family ATPase [Polyangiaceae bacterium]